MERIPFGVIGASFALELIARRLLGGYAGVAAVFDPDESSLGSFRAELEAHGVYVFRDLRKFLVCGIKAVVIRSGADSAEYAIKALRRGLDVLSEPPMAVTVEQVTRIERAAKDTGRRYSLALYGCHRRDVLLAGRLFRRGDIGRLLYAEASERVEPIVGYSISIMSCGAVGRLLIPTELKLRKADMYESGTGELKLGAGLLQLSGGAVGHSLCASVGIKGGLKLIGECGTIEAVGGRVIITEGSGAVTKSTSILPEGFRLSGMLGTGDFSHSSAIAGFAAMLVGDDEAEKRCIELSRASEIALAAISGTEHESDIPKGSPYGLSSVVSKARRSYP